MIIRIGIIILSTLVQFTDGFSEPPAPAGATARRMSVSLFSSEPQGGNTDWQGFNPFDPSSTKPSFATATRISLRKTQMQELMSNLLNAADDEQAMEQLLNSSKNWLLEPLEDDDAVLEQDSIYSAGMTRQDRYQLYRQTMQERIESARNSNVRKILKKLSDFVLAHE